SSDILSNTLSDLYIFINVNRDINSFLCNYYIILYDIGFDIVWSFELSFFSMNMFICSSLNNSTSSHILFTSKFTYISNFCLSQVKREQPRYSILKHPKIKSYSLVDSFVNHSSVTRIRNNVQFIFKTYDICVNRSVNAAVNT